MCRGVEPPAVCCNDLSNELTRMPLCGITEGWFSQALVAARFVKSVVKPRGRFELSTFWGILIVGNILLICIFLDLEVLFKFWIMLSLSCHISFLDYIHLSFFFLISFSPLLSFIAFTFSPLLCPLHDGPIFGHLRAPHPLSKPVHPSTEIISNNIALNVSF